MLRIHNSLTRRKEDFAPIEPGKVRMYERIFGPPSGAYFLYGTRTGTWKQAAE
jgi:cysteinyl-tRNA synthetase